VKVETNASKAASCVRNADVMLLVLRAEAAMRALCNGCYSCRLKNLIGCSIAKRKNKSTANVVFANKSSFEFV
jgi:hypothetical protein